MLNVKLIYLVSTITSLIIFFYKMILLRGNVLDFMLTIFFLLIFGIIFIFFVGYNIFYLKSKKRNFFTKINHLFISSIIPLIFVLSSSYFGSSLFEQDVSKAKDYCESLIPIIENKEKINNSRKAKFENLNWSVKKIIANEFCSYDSYDTFMIHDPRFILDGFWYYDFENKEWYYQD